MKAVQRGTPLLLTTVRNGSRSTAPSARSGAGVHAVIPVDHGDALGRFLHGGEGQQSRSGREDIAEAGILHNPRGFGLRFLIAP